MKLFTLTTFIITAVLTFPKIVNADVSEQVREAYLKVEQDKTTQKKDSLSPKDLQLLFNYARDHKVAGLTDENIKKYDPTGEIGYCYGRAMAVQLRARRMGVKTNAIKKLFIIGDLRSGEAREWRFHVTTLVRGDDSLWYAIDPLLVPGVGKNRPETLEGWVKIIRGVWDKKNQAFLYLVDSNAIMPDVRTFPWEKTDEQGNKITDLTFDPAKAVGFTPKKFGQELVYKLDDSRQEIHFLQAKESVDADQFDFAHLKMTVLDGEKKHEVDYAYHGYFQDLVDDIAKSVFTNRRERPLSGAAPEGTEIHGTEIHYIRPSGTEIHGTEIHGTEIHYGSLYPRIQKETK